MALPKNIDAGCQLARAEAESEFDDIISLVKSIFGVPLAAISLIDLDRQWFKAAAGISVPETPR